MWKLLKKFKPLEWLIVFVSLIFIAAQVWLDLKLPDYMSQITRLTQTPGSEMGAIWEAGGMMLLCTLGSLISAVIVGYFAAILAAGFSRHLRGQLFNKVESFSMDHPFDKRYHAGSNADHDGLDDDPEGAHHGSLGCDQDCWQRV